MKNLYRIIVILLVCTVLQPKIASAHSPNYIGTQSAITIPDPDTSRAYYGELTGAPATYTVTLPTNFNFYVNILSPEITGAKKDFKVSITSSNGALVGMLVAPESQWTSWYEDFAGDAYWKGPELKQNLVAGTYTITVSSTDNMGKYVLAPGEKEEFTIAGTPHTISQIYLMKTKFFGKPGYDIFQGVIGHVLLGMCAFLILVIVCIVYLIRRSRHKKIKQQNS